MPTLFETAIARLDEANREDPNTDYSEGVAYPKELLYAMRMTECLASFAPDASEALQLAVRCQHIQRWTIPRHTYPMDRNGYHLWRTTLAGFHAETSGNLLTTLGYDPGVIQRVQALVRKERIKTDPEVQTLEDVACLVFLEHYCSDFAHKQTAEKGMAVLRKTWTKLSDKGREAAMALPVPAAVKALIDQIAVEPTENSTATA